jgi:hypothetical protein
MKPQKQSAYSGCTGDYEDPDATAARPEEEDPDDIEIPAVTGSPTGPSAARRTGRSSRPRSPQGHPRTQIPTD